jgi:hypothetical protein
MVRRQEAAGTAHDIDLALFGQRGQSAGQLADGAVFPAAQCVHIDLWFTEAQAAVGHALDVFDHFRRMQQRLRRDAADVQADAAERGPAFDQRDLHAEVGGTERGGIAAGAGTQHQQFCFEIDRPGITGRDHCGSRCRCGRHTGWHTGWHTGRRRCCGTRCRRDNRLPLQPQDQLPLGNPVALLHQQLFDDTASA